MDSSLCLALAVREFGKEAVLSLSFDYGQRHRAELQAAEKIAVDWGVDHALLSIDCLGKITENALTDSCRPIAHPEGVPPNTLVVGRNGLMARLAAIHADALGAGCVYMGVMELEEANSGYRDCSRRYMDLMEEILRIDLDNPHFKIRTPLISMTKEESHELARELAVLPYLIENTVSCYEGLFHPGCGRCPACLLRNRALERADARKLVATRGTSLERLRRVREGRPFQSPF